MPLYLLRVYAEQLPQLRVQDALAHAQSTALGSGTMEPAAQRDLLRDWQRLTQPQLPRVKASPEALAAAGIGVRLAPREAR